MKSAGWSGRSSLATCALFAASGVAALGFPAWLPADEPIPASQPGPKLGLLSDDAARVRLPGAPPEERNAKNENFKMSPAFVVGPLLPSSEPGVPAGRKSCWRYEAVGREIVVEGIALGEPPEQPLHMTSQRVIYEEGTIFVRGVDFPKLDAVGKPVRVKGTLQLEPESIIEFGGYEPIVDEKWYYLEATDAEVLERVTDPHLVDPNLK
jgi:hypothetical protein